MIVVDTNVLAYLYMPGEHTTMAETLLVRQPEWAAPVLWRSEFRNILAGSPRRGSLTFEQVWRLQGEAEGLLAGSEYEVDSPESSNLSGTAIARPTTANSSRWR